MVRKLLWPPPPRSCSIVDPPLTCDPSRLRQRDGTGCASFRRSIPAHAASCVERFLGLSQVPRSRSSPLLRSRVQTAGPMRAALHSAPCSVPARPRESGLAGGDGSLAAYSFGANRILAAHSLMTRPCSTISRDRLSAFTHFAVIQMLHALPSLPGRALLMQKDFSAAQKHLTRNVSG